MLLYGIRYSNEEAIERLKDPNCNNVTIYVKETQLCVTLKDDVILLSESNKQSFDQTVVQLDLLIHFLNMNSKMVYTRENVITYPSLKSGQDYSVRENEYIRRHELPEHHKTMRISESHLNQEKQATFDTPRSQQYDTLYPPSPTTPRSPQSAFARTIHTFDRIRQMI